MNALRKRLLCLIASSLGMAMVATLPASGQWTTVWTATSGSNTFFGTPGFWSVWYPNTWDATAFFTNSISSPTVTNIMFGTGDALSGTHLFVISNSFGAAGGINKLLWNSGHYQMNFMRIGTGGIVELTGGSSMTWWRGGSLTSGGTMYLNTGTLRYGGEVEPNFIVHGTFIADTGTFVGNPGAGHNALRVASGGRLIANSGTFFINTANAFDFGGVEVSSGGTMEVRSGANLVISRFAGAGEAWLAGPAPRIDGTVIMSGGTLLTADGTAANVARVISNRATGAIRGFGTLNFNVANVGVIEARGGTLTLGRSTGNLGTWVSTNFGATASVLNFASFTGGGHFDLGGGTLINTGGMVRLFGGANVTLSTSYRDNPGTINFAGAGIIFMANVGGLSALTNSLTIVKTGGGPSTITTGYGTGGGDNSYGFINRATITAGGGATLTINPGNAFINAFSNAPSGRIEITTATSEFQLRRTPEAWGGGEMPVNMGTITWTTGGGTFSMLAGDTVGPTNAIRNAGSIIAGGATGGSWWFNGTVLNTAGGTIVVTNGTLNNLRFTGDNSGTVTLRSGGTLITGTAVFRNAGTVDMLGGTFALTNAAGGVTMTNLAGGVIRGAGTVLTGYGPGAQNYSIINLGLIVATNGTLFLNPNDAFFLGGVSNAPGGVLRVASDGTLTVNRSANAWDTDTTTPNMINVGSLELAGGTFALASGGVSDPSRFVRNAGTITGFGTISAGLTNFGTVVATNGTLVLAGTGVFRQAGTLDVRSGATLLVTNIAAGAGRAFSNTGTILMRGGSLLAGAITNTGSISGYGTIEGGGVVNSGFVLADATPLATVGTLTVRLTSFTNTSVATIGTVGTNTVLNVRTPGAVNVLINMGTISLSGGTIVFNDGAAGTITNFNVIAGVGDVSLFPIVNVAGASFVAQLPIPGLSNLIASVGITNSGVLGARDSATLSLTVGGGGATSLVNVGTIALQGGFIRLNAGAASVSNVSGGIIFGVGTQDLRVANMATGTIMASNGVFSLGLLGNLNLGTLTNFNAVSTIRLTNSILVNEGRVFLSGGTLLLSGSVVTNTGTITGPGTLVDSLVNMPSGFVAATNGTLNVATGAGEFVENRGTFDVASASTLNVAPAAWLNTGGVVRMAGGTLTGGAVTNMGTILGQGTITSGVALINTAAGTVRATNATLFINSTTVSQSGTMIGGTTGASTIQITNLTANFVNMGTMILDSPLGVTNLAFDIRRTGGAGDFTNAATGVIRGAGFLKTADGVPGGQNFTIHNFGSIIATNGALIVQPLDAFGSGGFVNYAGGTVTVASGATFGIQRTDNAWGASGTVPINAGVIEMGGGSLTFYGDGLAIANDRAVSNAPTGIIRGSGTIMANLLNVGTVVATNGNLNINNAAGIIQNGTIDIRSGGTFTVVGSAGSFQNNGRILLSGGTLVSTNAGPFRNIGGTISGFGTIHTGRLSGSGGANQEIINAGGGVIIATNGTLFLNPGDAFAAGGLSNSLSGVIRVADGATLALNRTANAWNNLGVAGNTNPRNLGTLELAGGSFVLFSDGAAGPGRFIENFGTVSGFGTISGSVTNFGTVVAINGTLAITGSGRFRQAGTLAVETGGTLLLTNVAGGVGQSFTNEASILMRGGILQAGVIGNTNIIFGWGTIAGGGVDNSGQLLASNGTLVAGLSSFTNRSTATLGTLSTNATLDVTMPGVAGQPLINEGTISMAGGTLLFNGLSTGTVTNMSTGFVKGVGLITQTIINNGTIMAAHPVSGLNVFSVGLSEINSATIGASNGAVLNVVISGGAGSSFNNNGSISMIGGSLIISNATPGVITNNLWITGVGTIHPGIVNNSTIAATVAGGVLDVNLHGGTNTAAGRLQAGSGATLQFSNPSVVNLGTISAFGLAGGAVQLSSPTGILTNRGLITGNNNLTFNSFVQNDPVGRITATNGVLTFNAINGLANTGTIDIQSTGTLQSNSSNAWANAGTIAMRGGTLRTGGFTNTVTAAIFTNTGTVSGFGTIIGGGAYGAASGTPGFDKSIVNLGTILATNPLSGVAQTLFITTGGATAQDGIQNLGTMIVSSNNTLSLNRAAGLPVLNTGTITIHNGTLTGSGVLSNTLGGIIEGYGTLSHPIVNLALGTIRATNGNMVMTSAIEPVNYGTFQIAAGATMTWNATNAWVNSGTVDMRGGTLRTGGITNVPPPAGPFPGEPFTNLNFIVGYGTIIGGGAYGGSGPGFDKSIVNLGTIIAGGGTLILDTGVATANRGLANLGHIVVATSNDTLILSRTAEISPTVTNLNFIYNSGTILIHGGTLTSRTSITNQFEGAGRPGLIQGFGHIALTNELVNLGTIRSTNTVAGGSGILRFVNPAGTELRITQRGTLAVEASSQMIFGADSNAPVANFGTIVMRGGILRSGTLTNVNLARISGYGTITSPIINSGTLLATSTASELRLTGGTIFNQTNGFFGATSGRLFVNAVFTNAGTVSFLNSVGTFASAVVNQGAWIMDPSTNVFLGDYTVASNGYITMTSGDVSIFKSNFVNQSRLTNQYDTLHGKFIFDGTGGHTQAFYVAGLNLGGHGSSLQSSNETSQTNSFLFALNDPIFGFSNNFALGTLEIGSLSSTSTLVLIDTFGGLFGETNDGKVAGLYVSDFIIHPGSLLIISNNVQFYFKSSNGVTGVSFDTLNPGDNVLILGSGSFHQLVVIPEPSILMLLIIGSYAILWYRRQRAGC